MKFDLGRSSYFLAETILFRKARDGWLEGVKSFV